MPYRVFEAEKQRSFLKNSVRRTKDPRMAGAKDEDRDTLELQKYGRKSRRKSSFGKLSHSRSPVYIEKFRKPCACLRQDTCSEKPDKNFSCNLWLIYRLRASTK